MSITASLFDNEQLKKEILKSSVFSDMFDSISLVERGISKLFVSKPVFTILRTFADNQTSIQRWKKKIMKSTLQLNGDQVISLLRSASSDEL